MRRLRLLGPAFVLLGCGCAASQQARFGFATPLAVPVEREVVAEDVIGSACDRWYLRLRRPEAEDLLSRAIADAVVEAPDANALADVTLETRSALLFFWNRSCASVRGDAVRVPVAEAADPELSEPRPGTP